MMGIVAVSAPTKIRNKAIAMEVYAYQAKDKELVAYATEIKMRATRRIGKLMEAQKHAGKLAKGTKGNFSGKRKGKGTSKGKGKGRGSSGAVANTAPEEASLAKQGVTNELAKQARKAAAMEEEKFEAGVKKSVAVAVASAGGANEVVKAARAENHKKQQAKRAEREANLAAKIAALPSALQAVKASASALKAAKEPADEPARSITEQSAIHMIQKRYFAQTAR
jgi:hypothetical protein